jgi:hypothetical protein
MLKKTAEIVKKLKYLTFKDLEGFYNDMIKKGEEQLKHITSLGSFNQGPNQYLEGECNGDDFKISIESNNKHLNSYLHDKLLSILRKKDIKKKSGNRKTYLERKAEQYSLEEVNNIIKQVENCNDWNVYDYTDGILEGMRIKSSHLSAVKKGLLDVLYKIRDFINE